MIQLSDLLSRLCDYTLIWESLRVWDSISHTESSAWEFWSKCIQRQGSVRSTPVCALICKPPEGSIKISIPADLPTLHSPGMGWRGSEILCKNVIWMRWILPTQGEKVQTFIGFSRRVRTSHSFNQYLLNIYYCAWDRKCSGYRDQQAKWTKSLPLFREIPSWDRGETTQL